MDEEMAARLRRLDEYRLEAFREEISKTDDEMSSLFDHRMTLAKEIGELKQRLGLPVCDPAREEEIISKGVQKAAPEFGPYCRVFLETCIELSKAYQESLRKEET